MLAQFADRPGWWEQPAPHRDELGNTWVILRLTVGNPEIVVETSVTDLADMIRSAFDAPALDELVTGLNARFPAPDAEKAMSDLELAALIEDTRELHAAALRVREERQPDRDRPLASPAGP